MNITEQMQVDIMQLQRSDFEKKYGLFGYKLRRFLHAQLGVTSYIEARKIVTDKFIADNHDIMPIKELTSKTKLSRLMVMRRIRELTGKNVHSIYAIATTTKIDANIAKLHEHIFDSIRFKEVWLAPGEYVRKRFKIVRGYGNVVIRKGHRAIARLEYADGIDPLTLSNRIDEFVRRYVVA